MPSSPDTFYTKNWISWKSFLGTAPKYCSYDEARAWMRKNKIINNKMFIKLRKDKVLPKFIPEYPARIYKKEYKGIWHFLGNDEKFLEYDQFIQYIKKTKKIDNLIQYFKWASTIKRPVNVPARADLAYKKDWKKISNDFSVKKKNIIKN